MTKLSIKQFSIVIAVPIIVAFIFSLPAWKLLASTTTYTIAAESYNGTFTPNSYIDIPLKVDFDEMDANLKKLTRQNENVRKKVYAVFSVDYKNKLTLTHVQTSKPKDDIYLVASMYLYNTESNGKFEQLPVTINVGQAIEYTDTYNFTTYNNYKWEATLRYADGHAIITELRKPGK